MVLHFSSAGTYLAATRDVMVKHLALVMKKNANYSLLGLFFLQSLEINLPVL